PECRVQLTRLGVNGKQLVAERKKDSRLRAIRPIRKPAILVVRPLVTQTVEAPDFLARRRIERHNSKLWRREIHHAINHDRIALNIGPGIGIATFERPRDFQLIDVLRVDLLKRGIVNVVGTAPEGFPTTIVGLREGTDRQGKEKNNSHDWNNLVYRRA